ncbi:winged helix-turn-helix transcriptional regulator, partial [Escherichia coli]|nr:winged helix-turn-helix transcriptional regulator [Escherichia coli]
MELNNIDFQILRLLSENSRIQWKDLGEKIHMTGQAVGNRIKKLEDNGVIKAYSLIIDEMKLGFSYTAFMIIY